MFTLGVTEEEILDRITRILDSVCAQEKKLAEAWYKADALAIEDRIYRAEGTARYARSMSSKEWEKLYSLMRLGAELSINQYKPTTLDGLYKNLRPAVLAAIPEGRTPEGRDRLRADMLRQSLEKEVIE
jgi:protein arginine kinase